MLDTPSRKRREEVFSMKKYKKYGELSKETLFSLVFP